MEFGDLLSFIHTGGQSAMMILLYFVFQNWRIQSKALKVLESIDGKLTEQKQLQADVARTITNKIDDMHDQVIALPMNILRTTRK
jgi:hypothetical protein